MLTLLANAAGTGDTIVSYVGEFILGGIALLAIYVAKWAIDQLKAAKDQTIIVLEKSSDKKDRTAKENAEGYQRTATATVTAIEKLTATENEQTTAIRENTRALQDLRVAQDAQQKTLDSVVRDAVRRRSGDKWPARHPAPPEGGE